MVYCGKKILIICYSFPPFPGVGGRRWAKFSKSLAESGYDVYVISSENPFRENSQWSKDINNSNIKVSRLQVKFPRVMLLGVRNIADKITYRLYKYYFSMYSKGVTFERTFFWRKQLLSKASEIISKEAITNVVVSIPPYRLAVYSLELKKRFPHINLVVDYRDPWTDNTTFHGFKNLAASRVDYEKELERKVLSDADKIISVSEKMTKDFVARGVPPTKVYTIPNGFDPSDISAGSGPARQNNKIKFVYAGSLYNDLDYIILPLLKYLNKLQEKNMELYSKLSFDFYGQINKEMKEALENSGNKCITVHNAVPLAEMQEIINNCDFCILITTPGYSVVFNTKFCEYLANRKPIVLFAMPSEASDFLVSNKLGFYINPENIDTDLERFFSGMDEVLKTFNTNFDLEPFSVPFLTQQLEKLLV